MKTSTIQLHKQFWSSSKEQASKHEIIGYQNGMCFDTRKKYHNLIPFGYNLTINKEGPQKHF